MLKAEARKWYRTKRKEYTPEDVASKSEQIFHHIKHFDFTSDQNFHIFLPIEKNNEINTYPLINWLFSLGKSVVTPLVVGDDMINCKVEPHFKTELNALHIPEPIAYTEIDSKEIDVVFVPMFVADQRGNRVGYGGGYYDKFLSRCRPTTKKIGLTYFRPIDIIEDAYEGDIPLNYLVTPEEIVSF